MGKYKVNLLQFFQLQLQGCDNEFTVSTDGDLLRECHKVNFTVKDMLSWFDLTSTVEGNLDKNDAIYLNGECGKRVCREVK